MGVPKGEYGLKLSRMGIPEREPARAVVADDDDDDDDAAGPPGPA